MISHSIIENKVILYILNNYCLLIIIVFLILLTTGIRLTEKETIHLCLTEIENMLQANRRSLRDFPSMPYAIGYARNQNHNNLIHNEMAYDKEMLPKQYNTTYQLLTGTHKL